MAQIKGTNVIAPVVPLDTADVHPSHEALYGKGGYRTVATTAARDAIPAARREAGMLVFVQADGKVYKLDSDLTTWSEFKSGASTWTELEGKPTAFNPASHAASHGQAGGDPVTIVAAQVSDFTAAVIAAAPPTTNASLLTSGTLPDARLSSNIARTSDVSSAVANLVGAAPATLDTLNELATALGNDASFATTVTNSLAAKAPINNPTFTGTVSGVTKAHVGLGNVPNVDATARANHTGTQAISTVSGLQTALDNKAAASHTHNGEQIEIFDENANGTTLFDGSYAASFLYKLNDDAAGAWEFLIDGRQFRPENVVALETYGFDIFDWNTYDSLVTLVSSISSAIQSRADWDHPHGNITNDGRIGTTSGQIVVTTTSGALTTAATISASSVSGLATVATSGSAADLSGTLNAARLPSTAVTAGSYGGASSVSTFTVDATGRLTAAGSTSIAIAAGAVSGLAAVATSGSASDLSAGTVPIARIPTGSTSSTVCIGNDARLVSDGNKGDITVGSSNTSWTINAGAVVTADLADSAVTTAKIANAAVTLAKTTGVQKTITSGTAAPTGGSDGDIYLQYS